MYRLATIQTAKDRQTDRRTDDSVCQQPYDRLKSSVLCIREQTTQKLP